MFTQDFYNIWKFYPLVDKKLHLSVKQARWAKTVQRFSRAGPRGRAREWATQGVHPLSWLLNNNRLEKVCGTLTKGTFSSWLLLSNQDKGCTPSVAHFLPLPLPPGFCSTCLLGPCVSAPGSSQGNRKPLILEIPWSRMIWHVFLEPVLELHLLSLLG